MKRLRGDAVDLLLGTARDEVQRLKPQNLVARLPIRKVEAAK